MSYVIEDTSSFDHEACNKTSLSLSDLIDQARRAVPLSLEELIGQLRKEAHPRLDLKRIRRGIANLRLMMTLTNVERSEWLWGIFPTQYYFEFRGLRIYRRNCRSMRTTKDRERRVSELQHLEEKLKDLSKQYHTPVWTPRGEIEQEIAKHLIHLAPVVMAEMAETISANADRHIGQIYNADDCLVEDVDLVDIYSWINNYTNQEEAVCDIFARYGLKENLVPVDVDGRTHWHMYVGNRGQWVDDNIHQDEIVFRSRNHVYGKVVSDRDGLYPCTYWCKSKDTLGTKLCAPFEAPMPLWNLEKIQNHPEKRVILSENLVGAYHQQKKINDRIEQATELKRKLLFMEDVYNLTRMDPQFETTLRKTILGEQDPCMHLDWCDFAYVSARIAFAHNAGEMNADRIFNGYYYQMNNYSPCGKTDEDYLIALESWSRDHIRCDELLKTNVFLGNVPEEVMIAQKRAEEYYKKIATYVSLHREKNKRDIENLETELENREKHCFSSWFGGEDAIFNTNWKELKHRHVIYVLAGHHRASYRKALKISIALGKYAETLAFFDGNRQLSANDVEAIARDEHKLDKATLLSKNKLLTEGFDVFDPTKQIKPLEYVLDGVVSTKSTTLLYAPTGVGKTWFTMCLAQAVAHGSRIFQNSDMWKATKPRYIAYIDSEMNEHNFLRRWKLMDNYYQTMKKKASGNCQLLYKQVSQAHLNLGDDEGIDRDRITDWLAQSERDGKPVELLILDNLSTLTGFRDSSKAWNNIFTWLSQLSHRKKNPIACIVVHHANKQGKQRGSSAKTATADNVIRLEHQTGGKRGGYLNFIVHIEKGRDIPDTTGFKGHIPVEILASEKKFSCKIVCPLKDEDDKKKITLEYLFGKKRPPLDVIASLTGVSINTVKEYSRKYRKLQDKESVDEPQEKNDSSEPSK